MATNTPRYLVENDGTNDGSLQIALSNGAQICMRTGVTTITLLVPTLKSFAESAMGGFLGAANAKALGTNKPLAISDTLSLQLSSLRTVSREPERPYGLVIGVHLRQTDFSTLDALDQPDTDGGAEAIMLVPWLAPEGQHWQRQWQPEVLGPMTWPAGETIDNEP